MRHYVNGTGANAARRPITAPAPTIHFGERLNTVVWEDVEDDLDEALDKVSSRLLVLVMSANLNPRRVST
jgi:hypothetical protein